jgi:hypothetical protein
VFAVRGRGFREVCDRTRRRERTVGGAFVWVRARYSGEQNVRWICKVFRDVSRSRYGRELARKRRVCVLFRVVRGFGALVRVRGVFFHHIRVLRVTDTFVEGRVRDD